jgi:hypothetical protein
VDEYVRRSYKFAHAETLEVGPIACLPEPPEPHDPSIQKKRRYASLDVLVLFVVIRTDDLSSPDFLTVLCNPKCFISLNLLYLSSML